MKIHVQITIIVFLIIFVTKIFSQTESQPAVEIFDIEDNSFGFFSDFSDFDQLSLIFRTLVSGNGKMETGMKIENKEFSLYSRKSGNGPVDMISSENSLITGMNTPFFSVGPLNQAGLDRFLDFPSSFSYLFTGNTERPFTPDKNCDTTRTGFMIGDSSGIFAVLKKDSIYNNPKTGRTGIWFSTEFYKTKVTILFERASWKNPDFESWFIDYLPYYSPGFAFAYLIARKTDNINLTIATGSIFPDHGKKVFAVRAESVFKYNDFTVGLIAGLCDPQWYGLESEQVSLYGLKANFMFSKKYWGVSGTLKISDKIDDYPEKEISSSCFFQTLFFILSAKSFYSIDVFSLEGAIKTQFPDKDNGVKIKLLVNRKWSLDTIFPETKFTFDISAGKSMQSKEKGFGICTNMALTTGKPLASGCFSLRLGNENSSMVMDLYLKDVDLAGKIALNENLEFRFTFMAY